MLHGDQWAPVHGLARIALTNNNDLSVVNAKYLAQSCPVVDTLDFTAAQLYNLPVSHLKLKFLKYNFANPVNAAMNVAWQLPFISDIFAEGFKVGDSIDINIGVSMPSPDNAANWFYVLDTTYGTAAVSHVSASALPIQKECIVLRIYIKSSTEIEIQAYSS